MSTLFAYRSNIHSQNGEDGVLAEILRRLKISKGWFVEFGAWDGMHLSNTYALAEAGWQGVEIEGHEERYNDLLKTVKKHDGRLVPIKAMVAESGPNSLDNLLSKTAIPKDFEVLSIDIDSYDYEVWSGLKQYNPAVVIIEICSHIPVGVESRHGQDEKNPGSSFSTMLKLGKSKGYTLVCHTGNLFFVRNDLVAKLNLPASEIQNPDSLFCDLFVRRSKAQWIMRGIKNKLNPFKDDARNAFKF